MKVGEQKRGGANLALLKFLHQRGKLTDDDLTALQDNAQKSPLSAILERIEAQTRLQGREIAALLAESLRLPLVDLSTLCLDSSLAIALKAPIATAHEIVPIRVGDTVIEIATANPLDHEALRAVEFTTGRTVRAAVTTSSDVRQALASIYRLDDSLTEFLDHSDDEDLPNPATDREAEFGVGDTELPPVVKLVDRVLSEATNNGASDVHIEPSIDAVLVRYRIDGILEEAFRFPKWLQNPLVGRFKIMANLDIAERRRPQDGRTKITVHGRPVDFRVSSLPTHIGEKITLRILDAARALRPLGDLGLPDDTVQALLDVARAPEGMILVTGPTGSGKTTTLYAVLQELTSVTSNIVTIENPVEYQVAGINQVDINDRQGLTFAGVLRSVLRQDPDVILVGEIRDKETAQIAFQAAQTGHLVLSTLHTNDSVSTITRLLDLGVEPYLIASSLHLVMAQRLVRRTCLACAESYQPDDDLLRKLPIGPEIVACLKRGTGCDTCRNFGYDGRVGLYESLSITSALGRLIESGAGESQLRDQARRDGYRQLLDDAEEKLTDGKTTLEEVLRVVQVSSSSLRCPTCRKEVEEDFALCPFCGTGLNTSCTGCDRRLDPTWARCPYCGTEAPAGASRRTPHQDRTFKALVVDDDTELLSVLRTTLEKSDLGLDVVTATDGIEALELAAAERPDVILIDFSMPGMSGAEVVAKLRQETATAHTPVMMLTGYDNDEYMEAGFRAGIDDFVLKPFRRDQLVTRVRRMLERAYGSAEVAVGAPAD